MNTDIISVALIAFIISGTCIYCLCAWINKVIRRRAFAAFAAREALEAKERLKSHKLHDDIIQKTRKRRRR